MPCLNRSNKGYVKEKIYQELGLESLRDIGTVALFWLMVSNPLFFSIDTSLLCLLGYEFAF